MLPNMVLYLLFKPTFWYNYHTMSITLPALRIANAPPLQMMSLCVSRLAGRNIIATLDAAKPLSHVAEKNYKLVIRSSSAFVNHGTHTFVCLCVYTSIRVQLSMYVYMHV